MAGLKRRREVQVASSRDALLQAIDEMNGQLSTERWAEAELARRAGLRSTVPLHSKLNKDILDRLKSHNVSVGAAAPQSPEPIAESPESRNARADAEVVSLADENAKLKRQLAALRARRGRPGLRK